MYKIKKLRSQFKLHVLFQKVTPNFAKFLLSPDKFMTAEVNRLTAQSQLCLGGWEDMRQPERLQTCYENHNAVRITGAYFGLPGL